MILRLKITFFVQVISSLSLLKCPRSLRFSSPEHFISHGVPSYLNASFENVNGPMSFSHGIKDTGFLR